MLNVSEYANSEERILLHVQAREFAKLSSVTRADSVCSLKLQNLFLDVFLCSGCDILVY